MNTDTTLAEARRRVKARRHAKQMAEADFGPSGYMALLCGGGDACPYTFEPWEPHFQKAEEPSAADAFTHSGAKAMLTPIPH